MIGAHFANVCREREWEVIGIARSTSSSRLVGENSQAIERCDIIDMYSLTSVFKKHKFET
jgi:putative NADH-flavin reductase